MVRTSDTEQTDSSLMVRSLAAWETAVAALREQLQVAQAATLAEQARALAAESRADIAEQAGRLKPPRRGNAGGGGAATQSPRTSGARRRHNDAGRDSAAGQGAASPPQGGAEGGVTAWPGSKAGCRRMTLAQAELLNHLGLLAIELGEFIPCPAFRSQQLVKLGVDGLRIAMLGALNDEGHQPCRDRRHGMPIEAGRTDRQPSDHIDEDDYKGGGMGR